ncbi:hypothetical protein [Dyella sp.]|jgi:hypothetical protein|uniref:hypothetical protein n=1 Tax=Dyella sp. TaxID=1869338 RepID=UPI002FD8F915
MGLFKQLARVDQARQRVARHREEMARPAAALLERGYHHPLATVGAAAGAGFVLGSLGVGPLRVPGLLASVSAGLAEVVAYGTRLIAEMGMDDGTYASHSDEP